ncbi:hypothetical protein BT69DRAFT_907330 [Atractiella rhizophila]|nr:hypothetical protein BT69DRAFT_907330 [Atractiella rhizophila]
MSSATHTSYHRPAPAPPRPDSPTSTLISSASSNRKITKQRSGGSKQSAPSIISTNTSSSVSSSTGSRFLNALLGRNKSKSKNNASAPASSSSSTSNQNSITHRKNIQNILEEPNFRLPSSPRSPLPPQVTTNSSYGSLFSDFSPNPSTLNSPLSPSHSYRHPHRPHPPPPSSTVSSSFSKLSKTSTSTTTSAAFSTLSALSNQTSSTTRTVKFDLSTSHPYAAQTKKSEEEEGFMDFVEERAGRMEEEKCPVCLEPLSLRLAGERPHIKPQCGHRLHDACFEAVYGGVARARAKPGQALGLCGVCRRDMKLGDGDTNKGKDKSAAIFGIPNRAGTAPMDSHKMRSISKRTIMPDGSIGSLHDPEEDDDLIIGGGGGMGKRGPKRGSEETLAAIIGGAQIPSDLTSVRSNGSGGSGGKTNPHAHAQLAAAVTLERPPVQPIITVRAEHASIARSTERDKKHLTCMVTVEIPSSGKMVNPFVGSGYGGGSRGMKRESDNGHGMRDPPSVRTRRERESRLTDSTTSSSTPTPSNFSKSHHGGHHHHPLPPPSSSSTFSSPSQPTRSPSPQQSVYSAYAYGTTPPVNTTPGSSQVGGNSPFAALVEDLHSRMADWKGHSPEDFGDLKMYDFLHVRKERNVREFLVYLFEEALLCVTDDRRKGGKMVDSSQRGSDKLRLKGRVYVRHIKRIDDTSKENGDVSLTITMEDNNLDQFVMIFKDLGTLDTWKRQIEALVFEHNHPSSSNPVGDGSNAGLKRDSMISERTQITTSTDYSSNNMSNAGSGYSSRGTMSSIPTSYQSSSKTIPEEEPYPPPSHSPSNQGYATAPPSLIPATPPRPFVSLDLMIILSVPSFSTAPSSFQLKLKVIKQTLDFIIHIIGPLARLSVVTYSAGEGTKGVLRKTPFLAVGKEEGRRRLEAVVNDLGSEYSQGGSGEMLGMIEHKEDRVNVVTAVNLALDIVLQRKAKSALTGMILMNDGRDGAQKQQMDLVMARAEAANVPIHAFGWGKSHDPSSLWLLSNHTAGTYTFVREWYHLRDCLAGCIGGMLSVALTNFRLHLNVPERRWFRIRKVAGTQGAIVSSDGKDVDIDLGELRYGEKKEMLVEVEMAFYGNGEYGTGSPHATPNGKQAFNTATDEFFLKKVGLNPATLDEFQGSNFYEDDLFDGMIDEVPLFEVNAAYRDPAVGKYVSRLPYPSLLTITLTPPAPPGTRSPPLVSDPAIVRRRLELLVADMLTRTLLLMSRRNDAQAQRLLSETKRIVTAIMSNLAPMTSASPRQYRRTSQHHIAHNVLVSCLEDIDIVLDGTHNREQFDCVQRNYAAQQAVVLRDQKAWTARSGTERVFFTAENAIWMVGQSQHWLSRTGDD